MRSIYTAAAALAVGLSAAHAAHAQGRQLPEFRLCTGSPSGAYQNAVGPEIASQARGILKVTLVLGTPGFEGSGDNLDKMSRKECDGAVVQADAFGVYLNGHSGSALNYEIAAPNLYKEAVHLICNTDVGISRITKLVKGQRIQIGPATGGTSTTWSSFVAADKGTYADITTGTMAGERAANFVSQQTEKSVCMLSVVGVGAPLMREVNNIGKTTGKLALVSDDDRDLLKTKDPKGQLVYSSMTIPKAVYPGLMRSDVNVAAVSSQIAVSTDWIDAHPGQYEGQTGLIHFINAAIPGIREKVGQ